MKKKILSIILIVIIVMIVSITTTYATNYLYNSNEVYYDNTNSNLTSSDVQGAIDELYAEATNYSSINTRVNTLESYFNNNTAALNIVESPVKINGNYVPVTITLDCGSFTGETPVRLTKCIKNNINIYPTDGPFIVKIFAGGLRYGIGINYGDSLYANFLIIGYDGITYNIRANNGTWQYRLESSTNAFTTVS